MNALINTTALLTTLAALITVPFAQNQRPQSQRAVVKAPSFAQYFPADTSRQYKKAPNFSLTRMNGETFTLYDHLGKVIVVNIWATWCGPCRREIPGFIELQRKMKDEGVLFVGVSIDEKGWKAVRPFAKKYDFNYPVMVDDGSVFKKYGPFHMIPMSFIINKKGGLEYVAPGMISKEKLKPILKKLANR